MYVRSGETISKHFHTILQAVITTGKKYIKHDHLVHYEEDDQWKWFKVFKKLFLISFYCNSKSISYLYLYVFIKEH